MQTAKDLFSGAAGGIAQVLLGKESSCASRASSYERAWDHFAEESWAAQCE